MVGVLSGRHLFAVRLETLSSGHRHVAESEPRVFL